MQRESIPFSHFMKRVNVKQAILFLLFVLFTIGRMLGVFCWRGNLRQAIVLGILLVEATLACDEKGRPLNEPLVEQEGESLYTLLEVVLLPLLDKQHSRSVLKTMIQRERKRIDEHRELLHTLFVGGKHE